MFKQQYVVALIAAAGLGQRMGLGMNKQFVAIGGRPILAMTVEKFDEHPYIDEIFLILKKGEEAQVTDILSKLSLKTPLRYVFGGMERQDSIRNGLSELPSHCDIVLTHDGARPFISKELITKSIEGVLTTGASVLAVALKDTVKVSEDGRMVSFTPNRKTLFAAQTPQVFFKGLLLRAYAVADQEGYTGTDDCSLVEKIGGRVRLIEGSYENIKITTPEDLLFAENLVQEKGAILAKYGYDGGGGCV